MKKNLNLSYLIIVLILAAGCSKPSLQEALNNDDTEAFREIINSGDFDPNIWPDESDVTLFEYVVRKYNDPVMAEKIASHPKLTVIARDKATYSLVREIRNKDGAYVIDDPDQLISLEALTKAFYLLIKPLPSSESTLPKTDLGQESLLVYNERDFYILGSDGAYTTVKFDKPFETNYILDVSRTPEYKDVIPSAPGKELVFYILHPGAPGPKNYVKVFADPSSAELNEMNTDFWNDKLLFAAVPPYGYTFDGSMDFPDDMEIQYNKIITATDYEGYIDWVEENLHDFVWSSSKSRPKAVPDQFNTYTDFENYAPVSFNKEVADFGYDLTLFRSIYDYGEPMLSLKLAVYKDRQLLATKDIPENGEYMYEPMPMVSLEDGKIKVEREGYNTADVLGDVPPEDFVAEDVPDTTYYYTVNEKGELIPWSDGIIIEGNQVDRLSTEVELSGFGDVRFVSSKGDKLNLYLVSQDTPIYQFPSHEVNQWMPEEDNEHEWKYLFSDLNGDGTKDLIYMASAITGSGPNGMDVFWSNSIYIRKGDEFVIQTELPYEINELATLEEVKSLVITSL
jgi:hypothetical protein